MRLLTQEDKNSFYEAFLHLKTKIECKNFLRDLLTENEINEFANRWKVARLLNNKLSYLEIEEKAGMSSTTIARISKWINEGMGGYKLMLKRMDTVHDLVETHHHHNRLKAE